MNAGKPPEPTVPEPGHKAIVWTAEAEQRLARGASCLPAIPCAKLLRRSQLNGVILRLIASCWIRSKKLGEDKQSAAPDMAWSAEALELLESRLSESPEMAMDFMFDLYKSDAEELCRKQGLETVTVDILKAAWETPHAEVLWSAEARSRLDNAPDFVRSGIKKAAERRARREGLMEIGSDDLTRFRNESMMKAVKRMKAMALRN